MDLKFMKLPSLLLLLPATLRVASSNLPSHPAQSPSANQNPNNIICHGLTCYPRVFVPTHEFQVIHDDQEVPSGLHYRINIETGVREAKINVPGEGRDIEASTIELPSEGGHQDIVFVSEGEGKEEQKLGPNVRLKGGKAGEDGHGAIKPPLTAQSEQLTFTDSVDIVLSGEKKHTTVEILTALNSLENLVHEIYWGLKISTPEKISSLLYLISTSTDPRIRSAAALVIGSALQNNPKALASATTPDHTHSGKNNKSKEAPHLELVLTLLSSLQTESNPQTLSRLLYALNQAIKSPQTHSQFHSHNGLSTLHSLYESTTLDKGEFKAKCSTFIEDNFLNPEFEKDLDTDGRPIHKADSIIQKVLGRKTKETDRLLVAFCKPLQSSLIDSEKQGIVNDDVKGKILSALVALRKRVGTGEKRGCPASEEFLVWFGEQVKTGGKTIEELEDAGEWFKLKAMEFQKEGSFDGDAMGRDGKRGWSLL